VAEYSKAPQVTRDRLYIEAMQQIMSTSSKVLVDQKGGNNLLYLPLDKLMQLPGAAASEQAKPAAEPPPPQDPATARSRDAFRSRERESR
jgi:modulator of FtsH protease HflK